MALFKKLTKKVVSDVKETIKEETQKTTEEIKSDVLSAVKEVLPELLVIAAGIVGLIILKKVMSISLSTPREAFRLHSTALSTSAM